jgi:ribosomal protein L18
LEKQLRQLARKKRLTESGMKEPKQKRRNAKKQQNLNVLPTQPSMSAKIEEEGKQHTSITWTAEDDEMIVSMITGGSSYTKIASALGKRLEKNDISNSGITN